MVTVDELKPGTELPAPMDVAVTSVNWNVTGRRAEIDAVDTTGNPIRIIDFNGANNEVDWRENHQYRISDCSVKRGTGGFELQLEPSGLTTIKPLDPTRGSTRLFVVGDTHVGYRHRSRSDKNKWSGSVDCREIFTRCLERARRQRADAVIHAGDVFDHDNTKRDRESVKREINRTVESGIPFYYVLGNHDDGEGRNLLDESRGVHLADGPHQVEGHSLNLLGVDHAGEKFPESPPQRTTALANHQNILVVHEKPYPVVDENGIPIYNRDGIIAEISEYFLEASYGIDYLVSGHQHLANRGVVRGIGTEVMVTGSPAQLRKPREENPFSTWLLTISDGDIDLKRHPL